MSKVAANTSHQHFIRTLMRLILVVCLVVLWLSPFAASAAHAATVVDIPLRADEQVLEERAFEFWQRLNEARSNPLAAAQRLKIPEDTVRMVFSDQPWILEEGLPPLAWNDHLRLSAAGHGRDMFDRLFYSYVSPDGSTFDQRIAASGYEAQFTGETINALFFESFVPIDRAVDMLVDTLIRDELTNNVAGQRNIFEPGLSEAGISFFAESIDLLGEQPFVYLVVLDFATPVHPQPHLIGLMDRDSRLAMRSPLDGRWSYVPVLTPGVFQLVSPPSGTFLAAVTENGLGPIASSITLGIDWQMNNYLIDMRPSPVPD